MKHYGDITKIKGDQVEIVDIIVGGSPCQDLSIAGQRKGLKHSELGNEETTRSGLFMEQIRIIKEQHDECRRTNQPIRPRFLLWENVPGALSSGEPSGEDFRVVLEEVARIADSDTTIPRLEDGQSWSGAGCILGDRWSIAWRVHDLQFWGCPQRRRRIALVADFRGQSAPEILFERPCLSGDSQPLEETRTGTPETLGRGANSTISFQERAGCNGGGKGILIQHDRTGALSTLNNQSVLHTRGGQTSLNHECVGEDVSYTLNCVDHHAVCCSQDAYDKYTVSEQSATIKQSGGIYGGGSESLVISGHSRDSL